jgi:predicted transcriptional regulator
MKRAELIKNANDTLNAMQYANMHGLIDLLIKEKTMRPMEVERHLNCGQTTGQLLLSRLVKIEVVTKRTVSAHEVYYTLNKRRLNEVTKAMEALSMEYA